MSARVQSRLAFADPSGEMPIIIYRHYEQRYTALLPNDYREKLLFTEEVFVDDTVG
jgi:hypothetical protein